MAPNVENILAGRRILVLEDEVIIALELQLSFADAGAQVEIAQTVEIALEVLSEAPVDAAVLDVNLGHSGTCAEVATLLLERGVPFILHSGDLVRHGELVHTINAPVIPKPAAPQELIAEIGRLLAGATADDEGRDGAAGPPVIRRNRH